MTGKGRYALAAIVALAAGAVVAVLLLRDGGGSAGQSFRGSLPPPGIELPEFSLRDSSGELVRSRDLRGSAVLVTFLDTQCTESCPVIASQIGQALHLLTPEQRARVVPLAITSDPAEDTPESIRAFLRRHRVEGRLRYLVGSERELRPVWGAFSVVPSLDTGDDSLHSAPVRIFGPHGVWVSTLHAGADLTPDNLAHDLVAALESA